MIILINYLKVAEWRHWSLVSLVFFLFFINDKIIIEKYLLFNLFSTPLLTTLCV